MKFWIFFWNLFLLLPLGLDFSSPLGPLFTQIRPSVPYQAWNYTWRFYAHDNSEILILSKITSAIWLPEPQVIDAARLGQGSTLTPYGRVRFQGHTITGPHPDLIQPWADSQFFVCRNRQDSYCGQKNRDLFCRKWGCEETGSAYWIKNADVSHIPLKVQWNETKSRCSMSQPLCSPIKFTFTSPSPLSEALWMRGIVWGLRFHHSTWPGFSFKIQLFKEPLNLHDPIAMGPNTVLVRRGHASSPKPSTTTHTPILQATPTPSSANVSVFTSSIGASLQVNVTITERMVTPNSRVPDSARNEILDADGSFWSLMNATDRT